MHYVPHSYQLAASRFIVEHDRSAIFLECGLGKTAITLDAIAHMMHDAFEISRTLIVAPLRVARMTWPQEVAKWDVFSHLSCAVCVGTPTQRKAALRARADITVINREMLSWLVDELGTSWPFDMVVLDELSSFKNASSKRVRAMKRILPFTKRTVGLTGTPASNGLMDLFAEFLVLDGGEHLGRYITHFRERYFVPDKRNQHQVFSWRPREGAEAAIYKAIDDMTLSMKSKDYLKLPPLVLSTIELTLDAKARSAYDALVKDMVVAVQDKLIDAASAAVLSQKLLQMAAGAIYSDEHEAVSLHTAKLDALEDVLEAQVGRPLLVAYWYKHDLARIQKRFPESVVLSDESSIERWNKGEIALGLIHPASAGHGLNLQAGGSALLWYSLTWSLELYQQTIARIYRQGQRDTVRIMHLIVKDTLEEDVLLALEKKEVTQHQLMDAVGRRLK